MRQTVRHLENTIIVKGIKLVSLGTKGFLGLGKKPNKYEAEIFWQAVVEIIYKQNARVSFELLDTKTFEEKKRIEEWQAQQDALEEAHRKQEEGSDDDIRDSAWRNYMQ